MANFQSFVSENFFKNFSPANINVDFKEITNHLQLSEMINTRELCGRELYEDLKTKFLNQTLSAIEIELVEIIKCHIVYRALYDALPFLSSKITVKGVQLLTGDNEQPGTIEHVKLLQNTLANRAEYFETRIVDFLILNAKDFPLYNKYDNKTGIINTQNDQFDSDIFLGTDYELRKNRYYYN